MSDFIFGGFMALLIVVCCGLLIWVRELLGKIEQLEERWRTRQIGTVDGVEEDEHGFKAHLTITDKEVWSLVTPKTSFSIGPVSAPREE